MRAWIVVPLPGADSIELAVDQGDPLAHAHQPEAARGGVRLEALPVVVQRDPQAVVIVVDLDLTPVAPACLTTLVSASCTSR